jgi:hypothetical protein
MTKEVSAEHTVRRPKSNHATAFSLLVLLLALLGVIVAALSEAPIIWMLIWPAPMVLIFTAARFIREGVHKRDGVLVLGRPALEPASDAQNVADDDNELEAPAVESGTGSIPVHAPSVFARRQNVEPGTAHGLAVHRHIRKNQHRSWRYNVPYVLEKGTVG